MKEYLTLLAENDLLEYEEGSQTYRTTEKGMRLLEIYNRMDELAPYQLSIANKVWELLPFFAAISKTGKQFL